jgi:thiamine-monophosphate kinase
MSRLAEIAFIADYLAPLATNPAALGLKDDVALLTKLPVHGLVVTADASVAGVHFFEDDDPGDAAYKALATNVSDLAAKAAKPMGYTLTLALVEAPTRDWAARFAGGLSRAQNEFGIALLGGDTVTARGAWWMSITAFGDASARGLVPRGGARAGDLFYVSGTLGDAALGLKLRLGKADFEHALTPENQDFLLRRYLFPEPRLALSEALAHYASAAMDISDGLALDLSRMCEASNVSAEVEIASIPLSAAASAAAAATPRAIELILSGGDDYEILAAVPLEHCAAFETASREAGVPVTKIGSARQAAGAPAFLRPDGTVLALAAKGFEHFNT